MAFKRGQVVVQRRYGAGIVWYVSGDGKIWLMPIGGADGTRRHRAEVRIDPLDALDCGVPYKNPVVRCQSLVKVSDSSLEPEPIGAVPDRLLGLIVSALSREIQAERRERPWAFPRSSATPAALVVR